MIGIIRPVSDRHIPATRRGKTDISGNRGAPSPAAAWRHGSRRAGAKPRSNCRQSRTRGGRPLPEDAAIAAGSIRYGPAPKTNGADLARAAPTGLRVVRSGTHAADHRQPEVCNHPRLYPRSHRPAVVLDACTLFPMLVRDVLLTLAGHEFFNPKWSARIRAEWMRNQIPASAIAKPRMRHLDAVRNARRVIPGH